MADADWVNSISRVWILGGLTPDFEFDAVVREAHTSELVVTDNPVETGVVVSDHAYRNGALLEIEAAVSDNPLHAASDDPFASEVSRSIKAFDLLLKLQQTAEPFNVQTGLKLYENMIVQTIAAEQDKDSASVLFFRASLREVIIVSTQTITYPPRAAGKTNRQASKKVSGGEKKATAPDSTQKKKSILDSLIVKDGTFDASKALDILGGL